MNRLVRADAAGEPTEAGAPSRSRDAERSRRLILEVAIKEFAAYGLAGARIARIASEAQVDKKLIFYYFQNKEALYTAVLLEVYAEIRTAESTLRLKDMDPVKAIQKLTLFTWTYYLENPEIITLLNGENLLQARHLSGLPHIRDLNSPLVRMIEDILARGVANGQFKPGLDPVQLYISIAALAYFYISNTHTLSAIFGRNLLSRSARAERLQHIQAVILDHCCV